jgi:uncharacterized protein (DUF1499 family)
MFAEELTIVATLPGAGTVYSQPPVSGVRRIYLRRIVAHLYYTFDDDEVIIRALWSASRTGPADLTPNRMSWEQHYHDLKRLTTA